MRDRIVAMFKVHPNTLIETTSAPDANTMVPTRNLRL
jgi:hypothetical protein